MRSDDPRFVSQWKKVERDLIAMAPLCKFLTTLERRHFAVAGKFNEAQGLIERLQLQVANLDHTLAERDGQIVALNQALSERDKQIASLNLTVTERDGHIADLKAQIEGYESSRSWRLTAPLRAGRRLVDSVIRGLWFRAALSQFAHFAYRRLPLRTTTKVSIKASIFRKFGALFRDTVSYQRWEALESGHAEPYRMRLAAENADEYVPLSESSIGNSSIKLIAFYLPQYHPIPENDAWWGKGFTEWTNVTRTQPQFRGHYQPHLPGELGFYDLRLIEIQKRQIELARHFGIYGFCYHHYWFGGKRLLERPFNQVLANKELDLPFCICWANENWSRRWDGLDHEVLVAQSHSPEDDIALLRDIEPALRDDRYIRVNGKPLLMVYRPALLPDVRATAERWREYGRTAGLGDLYLVSTHAFDNHDPRDFGFDAAIEFPPNNFPAPVINEQMQLLNPDYRGIIYDYRYVLEHSRRYKRPDYTLYRGVCPSWDNEARMPGRGTTFAYSSPRAYREWLHNACRYTVDNFDAEHRLVFVNAWNEWAEGAHLEPDRKYGYAYLQATADALRAFPKSAASGRVVLVSHDAHFNGAQLNALNIVRSLTQDFGYIVDVILCGPGPLTEEFSRHATVHEFFGPNATRARLAAIVDELKRKQVSHCICNTSVVGDVCEALKNGGARVITLVHELPGIIQTYSLQDSIYKIAAHSDEVVFAAQMVRDAFRSLTNLDIRKTVILPQGLYQRNSFRDRVEDARKLVRQELGLGATTKIVLGVGFADFRKGVDFFVDVALRMIETRSDICFLWVGDCEPGMWTSIAPRIAGDLNSKRIRFIGRRTDPGAYFAGADIYLMTSREDPFPSVVLEALDVGVPVIGFEGAGGFCDLIGDRLGALVPAGDIGQMAGAVDSLLTDQDRHRRISIDARGIMEKQFDFRDYVHGLISHLGFHRPRVSVVVPNYNYARYLPERLESIFRQTYAPYEIIFLDDCSTDESVNVAEPLLKRSGIPYRLVLNSKNQGTYQQWLRGFKEAKGELIWLAEADDVCEPRLLERLVKAFEDRDVVLAYCQSKQIDDRGHVLANSYLVYTQDIEPDKWTRPYARNGEEEIRDSLAIKNTIPNVSATLIRRMELPDLEDRLVRFKASGDWYLYIYLLSHGKIAFDPEPLNSHRRHPRGVILGGKSEILMKEMVEIQEEVLSKHSVSQETLHKIKEIRQSTYLRLGLHRKGPPNFEDSIFAPHHAPELRLPATSTTQRATAP
jgi:glycosyltransferase involved in cell wall biosynthesis